MTISPSDWWNPTGQDEIAKALELTIPASLVATAEGSNSAGHFR